MITLKIIRGHRLKLWAERLEFNKTLTDAIDIRGMNVIHSETPINEFGDVRIVVLTKIIASDLPLPISFVLSKETYDAIVETVELVEESEP